MFAAAAPGPRGSARGFGPPAQRPRGRDVSLHLFAAAERLRCHQQVAVYRGAVQRTARAQQQTDPTEPPRDAATTAASISQQVARGHWLVPVALTLLALGVRLFRLDRKSVWFDEVITYFDAHLPWAQLLESIKEDVHPPLSYVLYHLWPGIDGGEFWLRLPAAVLGALAVVPAYAWARRIRSPTQAVLTSGFVALSALQIDLAQEARMYGLLLLLTATSLWLLDRVLISPGRGSMLAYAVVAAAMLYTHYYAALLLAAQGLAALLSKNRWAAIGALAAAGLTFMPWLPVLAQQTHNISADYWIEPPRLSSAWVTFRELAAHTPPEATLAIPLRIAYVVQALLLILGTWLAVRSARQSTVVLFGVVPLALALGISLLVSPVYAVRYISPLGLAFGFLIARGVTSAPKPLAIVAATVAALPVVTALGPLYTDPGYARADLRGAASAVQSARQPDEIVLHLGAFTSAPFDYYRVAQPSAILETNDRAELCQTMRQQRGAWLVTAYAPASDEARQSAEAGIDNAMYAQGLTQGEPMRFLGVSVFHLTGTC